jgi:sec-independent protein translocase protein TatB
MFNVGASELIVIVIAALLILGPKRLPEMARVIGKYLREFRRQTDEVRTMVEREFYRMDEEMAAVPEPALAVVPALEGEIAAPALKLPSPEGSPIPAEALKATEKKNTVAQDAAVEPDASAQAH